MSKSYYLGADLGTSSLKLALTSERGEIVKTVTKEYSVDYPKNGWSEQSPKVWWENFVIGVKELIAGDELKIVGLGVSGQMHGLVILDDNDVVIRPTILWNDNRTQKETHYLNEVIGKNELISRTQNIAFAGFTAPKLLWLKQNEPENFKKISKIISR